MILRIAHRGPIGRGLHRRARWGSGRGRGTRGVGRGGCSFLASRFGRFLLGRGRVSGCCWGWRARRGLGIRSVDGGVAIGAGGSGVGSYRLRLSNRLTRLLPWELILTSWVRGAH